MAVAGRRNRRHLEAWPGYVDVLSTLLMVIVFVLMIFVVAQLYLSQALTGKDQTLARLSQQIAELSEMLSMERGNSQQLKVQLSQLSSALTKSTKERDALQNRLTVVIGERDSLKAQLGDAQAQLDVSKQKQQELADAYKTID